METNKASFSWWLPASALIAVTIQASGTPVLVTFDGSYGIFNYSNIAFVNGTLYQPGSGFYNGVVSPVTVAYTYNGMTASVSGVQPFNFFSGYFTAAWKDGLQMEVQGFIGDTMVYDNTYTLNTTGPSFITLDYLNVDRMVFNRSGGTINPAFANLDLIPPADPIVMDNLTVDFFPAPVPPPPINITQTNGVVTVFWPTNQITFVLESSGDLTNPSGWTAQTNNVQFDGTNFYYTIAVPVGTEYFRLKR
jgi:hypothetical protein